MKFKIGDIVMDKGGKKMKVVGFEENSSKKTIKENDSYIKNYESNIIRFYCLSLDEAYPTFGWYSEEELEFVKPEEEVKQTPIFEVTEGYDLRVLVKQWEKLFYEIFNTFDLDKEKVKGGKE